MRLIGESDPTDWHTHPMPQHHDHDDFEQEVLTMLSDIVSRRYGGMVNNFHLAVGWLDQNAEEKVTTAHHPDALFTSKLGLLEIVKAASDINVTGWLLPHDEDDQ